MDPKCVPANISAFQTAVALAQYQFAKQPVKEAGEKASLDREHFEEVCTMNTQFKDYLERVHRADEQERAKVGRNRNDDN